MTRKAGGNLEAIKAAAEHGAELMNRETPQVEGAKPLVSEAADKVVDSLKGAHGKFSLAALKEGATRENGIMAGGAVVAADGIRRAVQRDEDGERHVVRGVVQTAVGVGAFAAALAVQRNKISGGGPER